MTADGVKKALQAIASVVVAASASPLAGCRFEKPASPAALYECESYTLFADSITDGIHVGYAPDDTTLISTFRTATVPDTLHIPQPSMSLRYSSDARMIDAVHNLSLWALDSIPGNLSTADISYLTDLALCYVASDKAKELLRSKVRDGRVVQGRSYGGGFPVATDAVAWIAAAWSVYEVTGDYRWLEEIYPVARKTLEIYETVVADASTGLFRGMQSVAGNAIHPYPAWMTPVDISTIEPITVNALTARAYEAASMMAMALGHDGTEYMAKRNRLVEAVNTTLWVPDASMYSMYLYGEPYPIAAGAVDNLGQGLAMVYNVSTPEMSIAVQSHTPVLPLGIPAMYPQLSDSVPAVIVPVTEAYWAIAASHSGNTALLQRMVGSLTYLSAMNLGVFPYYDASSGKCPSAVRNMSGRNPLGAAANIAAIYRGMLGLRFTQGGIEIHPNIPPTVDTRREVRNLRYRDGLLHILINGYGSVISSYKMDGAEQTSHTIPSNIKGTHVIEITLGGNTPKVCEINEASVAAMPAVPVVNTRNARQIQIKNFSVGDAYEVYLNGVLDERIFVDKYYIHSAEVTQFTSAAFVPVRGWQYAGMSSRPIYFYPRESIMSVPADSLAYTGTSLISDKKLARQFVETTESYRGKMSFNIVAPEAGEYLMEAVYSNALADGEARSGLCAIRLVSVNDSISGALVMPPTVKDEWTLTSRSNMLRVKLRQGVNRASVMYRKPYTVNSHVTLNNVLIKTVRFYKL